MIKGLLCYEMNTSTNVADNTYYFNAGLLLVIVLFYQEHLNPLSKSNKYTKTVHSPKIIRMHFDFNFLFFILHKDICFLQSAMVLYMFVIELGIHLLNMPCSILNRNARSLH